MEKYQVLQSSFEVLQIEVAELKLPRTIVVVCNAAVDSSSKMVEGPISAPSKIKWLDRMSSFRIMIPTPEPSLLKKMLP